MLLPTFAPPALATLRLFSARSKPGILSSPFLLVVCSSLDDNRICLELWAPNWDRKYSGRFGWPPSRPTYYYVGALSRLAVGRGRLAAPPPKLKK